MDYFCFFFFIAKDRHPMGTNCAPIYVHFFPLYSHKIKLMQRLIAYNELQKPVFNLKFRYIDDDLSVNVANWIPLIYPKIFEINYQIFFYRSVSSYQHLVDRCYMTTCAQKTRIGVGNKILIHNLPLFPHHVCPWPII